MDKKPSTALLTDMYELTMLDSTLQSGMAARKSVFEVFARRLPGGRRFGVVAGTGRVIEAILNFRFDEEELEYLRSEKIVSEQALDYLANYRFTGDLYAYPEGEIYFPNSPILQVIGTFAETVVLETVMLSILNHDSAIATAASRMTIAAHGRPCYDYGARRTHEISAIHAARAAMIGGFRGTSNLEAGRQYGLPVSGTAAHSFTLLHDSEEEAFRSQISTMGLGTTILVDTYDVAKGVENAVNAAHEAGGEIGAIRLDSGDLVAQAFMVRRQLDDMGANDTKIVVTSDLDEYALAALSAAPVDFYGVGTRLVTGSGYPTAEMVYKLVACEEADGSMRNVEKLSEAKRTYGGFKVAGRITDGLMGHATEELVVSCPDWETGQAYLDQVGARPLQVHYIHDGELLDEDAIGPNAIEEAAENHKDARDELPYDGWRLSKGDPIIPTNITSISSIDAEQ
ncbi:MAG: nicotinate phosphoribosyltransferase [Actinomycetaceae bacterium]|nr:nicotinate phosphoribosyltransferase [Actinomycetaceae bacterium]